MTHGRIHHMRRFVVTVEDHVGRHCWMRLGVAGQEHWAWTYANATRMTWSEAEEWCAAYNRKITTSVDARVEEIDDDLAAAHDALVTDREEG